MKPWNRATVIVTHLPTGIVSVCESERHQHRNKSNAIAVLRSKLFAIQTGLVLEQKPFDTVNYRLPDDVQYPNDLTQYKEDQRGKAI